MSQSNTSLLPYSDAEALKWAYAAYNASAVRQGYDADHIGFNSGDWARSDSRDSLDEACRAYYEHRVRETQQSLHSLSSEERRRIHSAAYESIHNSHRYDSDPLDAELDSIFEIEPATEQANGEADHCHTFVPADEALYGGTPCVLRCSNGEFEHGEECPNR